jgi:transcriptional regulator GlxA family with amidase domain
MDGEAKPEICLLTAPETSPGVLYGLYDVLSTVGAAYPDMVTGVPGDELLDVKIVARTDAAFRCVGNVIIEPEANIDDIEQTDAVVICDMYTPIDTPPTDNYQIEVEWLKRMYAKNALLASVCSGSAACGTPSILQRFIFCRATQMGNCHSRQ